MHPTVRDRLATREYARRCGDVSLERACDADLARHGYQDDDAVPVRGEALETTALDTAPERAVPAKPRRGRPPRPRCEHDQIVGRCAACEEGDLDDRSE